MRTAKEWRREIGDQCGSRAGIYTDEEIAAIQDEAIAHGMTLSAGIARNKVVECPKFDTPNLCDSCKTLMVFADDLLTARDNKVWRKE